MGVGDRQLDAAQAVARWRAARAICFRASRAIASPDLAAAWPTIAAMARTVDEPRGRIRVTDEAGGIVILTEAMLLRGEDGLDGGADPGARGVGLGLQQDQIDALGAAEMDLGGKAVPGHVLFVGFRAIGRARPDRARRVRLVEHLRQSRAVIRGRVRHRETADEAVSAVD